MVEPLNLNCISETKKETKKVKPGKAVFFLILTILLILDNNS